LSYEFDSLNLLTAEIGWNPGSGTRFTEQTALMYGETGNLDQSYHLIDDGNNSWNALDLGLNFQRGFKAKKDQLLTLSYKYSPNVNDDYNEVFTDQSMNFFFVPFQQKNRSGSVEQTAQLDYVHPVKKVDIEAGLKGILRNNFSKYEYLNQDPLTGDFLLDSIRSNEFDYQQNVFSFYNSYNVKFETWSVRAGLRIEKTIVDANFKTTATTVEQNYENFIPSIAIQKKFKNMSSLNLGYTQRIERPSIWQLNPFVYQNDPRNISTGNPQLEAVLTNNFEIGYSTFKKGSINVGASYSFANNTIQNVTILDTDSVSKSSFLNIGEDKKLGINANVSIPINKKINININSQLSYLWLEGSFDGRDYTNQGFQGNAFAFVSYTLPKEYRLRVSGGYYSPYIQL